MKDEVFIKELLQKGREAKEKVSSEFSNISVEQLNWQASRVTWSIAQCLDHLIASHSVYFSRLKKITEGNFKMDFWEYHERSDAGTGEKKNESPKKNTTGQQGNAGNN